MAAAPLYSWGGFSPGTLLSRQSFMRLSKTCLIRCDTAEELAPIQKDRSSRSPPGVNIVEVNGYPMAYQEVGSGPPLVLVHGSPNDYRTWPHRCRISRRPRLPPR